MASVGCFVICPYSAKIAVMNSKISPVEKWEKILDSQTAFSAYNRIFYMNVCFSRCFGSKIGFGMYVFLAIKTNQHNAEWLAGFVTQISEVKLTDVSSSLAM